ncbi:MAG: hypothetical protein B6I19_11045 [Bacteroidetes bacterium 4572_114]|nr:MAG: hypothetical protein B6I19_11045 [Bacteroidetes bacterium 4572_114]
MVKKNFNDMKRKDDFIYFIFLWDFVPLCFSGKSFFATTPKAYMAKTLPARLLHSGSILLNIILKSLGNKHLVLEISVNK